MRKNKWIKIITSIISPIFSLLGVSLFNMPIEFFRIIIFLWIGYVLYCLIKICIINKDIKDISRKMSKILRKISRLKNKEDLDDIIKLHEEKYQKKKKQTEKLYGKRKKIIRDLMLSVVISIPFVMIGCEPINTLAKELMNVVIAPFVASSEPEGKNDPYASSEPEGKNDPYASSEPEIWIRFALEYPDGYPLNNKEKEEFEILYNCLFYNDEDNLNEVIKSKVKIWINSCKYNVSLNEAITSSKKSTEYYSNIEESFTNENGTLLSSNLLDEVISGRKELFELYPNGSLAWLLANHMQTYALNYLNQTNDEKSILYFYLESIKYAQESLEFDTDIGSKYDQIKYIQFRYKDIAECKFIDKDIQDRAKDIYEQIQTVLDELQIS